MDKQINLVINGKGGVGKSFFATKRTQTAVKRTPGSSPGVILRVPKMRLAILLVLGGNSNVANHQQIFGILFVCLKLTAMLASET